MRCTDNPLGTNLRSAETLLWYQWTPESGSIEMIADWTSSMAITNENAKWSLRIMGSLRDAGTTLAGEFSILLADDLR